MTSASVSIENAPAELLEYVFSGKKVQYYLGAPLSQLSTLVAPENLIIITDENVYTSLGDALKDFRSIVIPAGEQHKNQSTVDGIIRQLIAMEADRQSFIIGVGGGVVTDITGYAASVYMRGVRFAFVPTTILAQVDASIGGKNGVDAGVYKNLVGLIRQPEFILFDYSLLNSLPREQWINGFAEIIKHGCIKDEALFALLEAHDLDDFRQNRELLAALIKRNAVIKSDVVKEDEFETGDRKLLNFGHTIGHAIENVYELMHGHAISIGMAVASSISVHMNNFSEAQRERVIQLLRKYHLPVTYPFDYTRIFEVLKMDKKRVSSGINFILLNKLGEAVIRPIPLIRLEEIVKRNMQEQQV